MIVLYRELADRIRGTISDLDGIVQRVTRAWARAQRASDDQDVYLDSAALNLHGFYSGLERLFEVIGRQLDQAVPASETWHRDLLLQMARDLEDIRPAVISQENVSALDEFRRFRHLVRQCLLGQHRARQDEQDRFGSAGSLGEAACRVVGLCRFHGRSGGTVKQNSRGNRKE